MCRAVALLAAPVPSPNLTREQMPHKTDRDNRVIELMDPFDREDHVIQLTEHQFNAVSGGSFPGEWNRVRNVSNVSEPANL
jgi:hypothetical protein